MPTRGTLKIPERKEWLISMIKKYNKIKLSVILIITTLILIPLLSSPVSAAITWNIGNTWTNNSPAGPTAGGVLIGAGSARADPATPPPNSIVTFTCTYSFVDTNPGGIGSFHQATMTVTPPGPPAGVVSTGVIFRLPGGGPVVGTLSVGPLTNPKGTVYTITVQTTCTDVSTGAFVVWTGNTNVVVN